MARNNIPVFGLVPKKEDFNVFDVDVEAVRRVARVVNAKVLTQKKRSPKLLHTLLTIYRGVHDRFVLYFP